MKLKMKTNSFLSQVFATKSGQQDTTAEILAAVGAGLVPATMAMIVPLALGRKRRSIGNVDNHQQFQQSAYYPILQPM